MLLALRCVVHRAVLFSFFFSPFCALINRYKPHFAPSSHPNREEAAEELRRVQEATKNERAKRWWRSNIISRVFVVWNTYAREERDRKHVENCHEKRRERVKDLFERVKCVEVAAEKGAERRSDDFKLGGNAVESVLVDLLEGGDGKAKRVAALRSLLDKCIKESDRGDSGGDKEYGHEHEHGEDNGDNDDDDDEDDDDEGGDEMYKKHDDHYSEEGERHNKRGEGGGNKLQLLPRHVRGGGVGSCSMSTMSRSTAVPKSVASMFSRHEERARGRAALNARYAALNSERDKRKAELESKRKYEDAKREAAKRHAHSEEKRREELALLRKKEELERRKEMWKLACMHHVMSLLGGVVMKRWKAKIGELRLKEKKSDLFRSDSVLSRYWKLLCEYVEVRKGLRRDLEARSARKADEYYFDALCWKVFSAWVGYMKTLKAKYRAVRSQNLFKKRSSIFRSWRSAHDNERLIWWEIEKHAQIKGRAVNLQHHFKAFKFGVEASKKKKEEDQEVARKMAEVRMWLE